MYTKSTTEYTKKKSAFRQKKRGKITINKLTYLDINEKNRDLIKQIYKLDFELYKNVKNLGILIKKNNCDCPDFTNTNNISNPIDS